MDRHRNNKGRFASKPVDLRKESQVPGVSALINNGSVTLVLVYADWCGHCHKYLPTWKGLASTPGRTANMVSVHHDMLAKVPAIANAKIDGYPSVLKVEPSGKIEEYKVPGTPNTTNAMPHMRDMDAMKSMLVGGPANASRNNTRKASAAVAPAAVAPAAANGKRVVRRTATPFPAPPADSGAPGIQSVTGAKAMIDTNARIGQTGGSSLLGSFVSAVQKAGPSILLLLASDFATKKHRNTYKSPKRSSRRASTRKNRS